LDEKPLSPHVAGCKGGCVNYYRLRQVDFDGKEEFSQVVAIDLTGLQDLSGLGLLFSPNPARQGITSLHLPEAPEAEGVLKIFDGTGRQVFYQKLETYEGGQAIPVALSAHPPGVYTARLKLGGKMWTERLIVAK
jgi:hypothetical protein